MIAIVQDRFGGPEVLRMAEVPVPEPAPTEVLVEGECVGVNPVDGKVRRGQSVAPYMGPFPITLGWDIVGVVRSTGPGVTRFGVGDRVFGMPRFPRAARGYAQFVTAPSRQLCRVPEGLDASRAATVPLPATTAWQVVVDTAGVSEGDRVLVLGASGAVGRFAVQLARQRGAEVLAVASARRHRELESLGASRWYDSASDGWQHEVQGVDLAIDLVGGETASKAVGSVRRGGLVISLPSNNQGALYDTASHAGVGAVSIIVEPDRVALESVSALIEDGSVQVGSPTVFPLSEVRAVHRLLDEGAPQGKMVLEL
jgi:NADPH:quinone reductase-like Zn-dependent oxidoreductase